MKKQNPQPRNEEIMKDTIFQKENLVYLTFFVNGSHQVEINGLKLMPGQQMREEFASNMAFDGLYDIRFLEDYAEPITTNEGTTYNILDNPNLKFGKFIYARFATGVEMNCQGCGNCHKRF